MWVWVEEERDIRILVHIGANIGAYWYILVFDKDEDALKVVLVWVWVEERDIRRATESRYTR